MFLLLDQGIPRATTDLLRASGIAVQHVGEIGLDRADDAEILQYAIDHDAVIVTHDSDFHAMLAHQNVTSPSVIRLRDPKLRHDVVAPMLASVWHRHQPELKKGAAVSIIGKQVRLRQLPFTSP
jgi:predicted nuclease of predicted toxin-antitoxin system